MSIAFDLTLQVDAFRLNAKADIPNSVTAIVGPSGSGKTTLLRCIAGLEKNATGTIRVGDSVWLDDKQSRPVHKRRLGYVFQHAALFEHLTVSQNIHYARKRATTADSEHSIEDIAQATRIVHLLDRKTHHLSGGERQRVALARALAANPQLLLLDEPLSALDHSTRKHLIQELGTVFKRFEIPALYVTHNLAEAARLCSHALLVESGSVAASGKITDVLAAHFAKTHSAPFSVVATRDRIPLEEDSLIKIETEIGDLLLPAPSLPDALPSQVLIHARDVGISLVPLPQSSFLNQVSTQVVSIQAYHEGQCLLKLECEGGTLLALVTNRSARELKLQTGTRVFALIKSVTFDQTVD